MRIPALIGLCAFVGTSSIARADTASSTASSGASSVVAVTQVVATAAIPASIAATPQAPQPTPASQQPVLDPESSEAHWNLSVSTLAAVLNGSVEPARLRDVIAPHAWMSPFERNRSESAMLVATRMNSRNVVSVHPYLHPCVSAASDLVADIANNPAIADSIRKQLVPPPGRDLRQADATMARWFGSSLDAQEGDPIALIAVYDDGQSTNTSPQLTLILVRGELSLSDGLPRVSRVLYGTIDSAAR